PAKKAPKPPAVKQPKRGDPLPWDEFAGSKEDGGNPRGFADLGLLAYLVHPTLDSEGELLGGFTVVKRAFKKNGHQKSEIELAVSTADTMTFAAAKNFAQAD